MSVLHFYIPPWLADRADRAGTIFAGVKQAAELAGWQLALHGEDEPRASGGYHLLYNRPVTAPQSLVVRKCGFEPFFRIEATNDRWDWQVATQTFATQKGKEWFRTYWQGQLFDGLTLTNGGYVFMPLQGRLLQQRHFQSTSPIEMIKTALQRDKGRPIVASLHPRETYTPQELETLAQISANSKGRFIVSEIPSKTLLAGCDYIVTQNSTLALLGMFAQKTPILFGEIDFHHLAGSVPHLGLDGAYAVLDQPRKWGAYLHWYFKENAINARQEEAPSAILNRLAALGWPL